MVEGYVSCMKAAEGLLCYNQARTKKLLNLCNTTSTNGTSSRATEFLAFDAMDKLLQAKSLAEGNFHQRYL